MTEGTAEDTTIQQGPLVQYGLYRHEGMVRFATDEETLVDLTGNEGQTYTPNENTEVWAAPGSPDWIDRMVRIRSSQASALSTSRQRLKEVVEERDAVNRHLEGLGEALRDEAESRGWCEEYDTFADDWGLPRCARDWEVTVTITVKARDEEAATLFVQNEFGLSAYSDDVVSGPEYDANEA